MIWNQRNTYIVHYFTITHEKSRQKKYTIQSIHWIHGVYTEKKLVTRSHNWTLNPTKIPPEKIPLNAVEREPVETRVLNPNASEASYKPKQRSYRKTKLKKNNIFYFILFFGGILVGGILSGGFYPVTVEVICEIFANVIQQK